MPVLILILIAAIVVGLNVLFGSKLRTVKEIPPKAKVTPIVEEFSSPVSRKYPILFWYALYHCAKIVVTHLWSLIFTRGWNKYTAQYVAQHNLHESAQYLKLQYIVSILAGAALFFAIYVFFLRTKEKKLIVRILKLFLVLDGFDLLSGFVRPSLDSIYIILSSGFDVLVLWSLLRSEPNIFKLLHLNRKN
jgi:glucan phosphoethanolaminetransferase (alkaline phosphatase superfamily)